MQQKLIVTLWKAHLKDFNKENHIYCRLTYNNAQRNSKPTSHQKNLAWKETFIFPLSKKEIPLKIEFIQLKDGEAIHFAKDQVAESISFGKSVINIDTLSPHTGSLPCKVDIIDKSEEPVGKIFIQYEVIKTEVAYTVEKQLDYFYLLKLTNFKVNFVRKLKNTPKFYLHFNVQGRLFKEDLPFQLDTGDVYAYNYPVKLYLKKEIDMQIELFTKDIPNDQYNSKRADYQTESSFSQSLFTEKKTLKSSILKKQKQTLELGKDKISALMDLNFKKDTKITRKLPITTLVKSQKRQIGTIQFQAEVFFRTKEELQQLEQQKKGLNPQKDIKPFQRKKNIVKQSNGIITINSILGRLQLFNENIIQNKNISVDVKLGNQIKDSTILQRPGKQLIFIDTFVFKRTWEETIKFTINLLNTQNDKAPAFYADLNLRQLFELGRFTAKKIKLKDQQKNYSGELTIDVEYKQTEQKKSPLKEQMTPISEIPQEQMQEIKIKNKREQIQQRMKRRQQLKQRVQEMNSMSTLAVLQNNDIILPPLKSASRMSTLSPKTDKTRGANVFNVNGGIKFTRSKRFESPDRPGYQSFTYVRESDFEARKKKGPMIGYGNKFDFTKVFVQNPGVGRYEIPSVWDKYK